jgi:hypothetical protein
LELKLKVELAELELAADASFNWVFYFLKTL